MKKSCPSAHEEFSAASAHRIAGIVILLLPCEVVLFSLSWGLVRRLGGKRVEDSLSRGLLFLLLEKVQTLSMRYTGF